MLSTFILKSYFVLRYLNNCPDFFDKFQMVNFKIYDVTNWITNKPNKHNAKRLKT